MATMITLTRQNDDKPVIVNVDTVAFVTVRNSGGLQIHFAGADDLSVNVSETANEIAEKVRAAKRD